MKYSRLDKARIIMRMPREAGIAIGPILFIIAILAVLVGALASGDNGFGTSSREEAVHVVASEIIDQGTALNGAMQRVLAQGGSPPNIYVATDILNANLTSAEQQVALYASSGGGAGALMPPATAVPSGAQWYFVPNATIPGVGTGSGEYAAVLPVVSAAICMQINATLFGKSSAIAFDLSTATVTSSSSFSLTAPAGTSDATSIAPSSNSFDATGATGVEGDTSACVQQGSGSYYYYQVLITN